LGVRNLLPESGCKAALDGEQLGVISFDKIDGTIGTG
jgi:hypothetical protein